MKYFLVYVEVQGVWTNVLVKATSFEEAEHIAALEVGSYEKCNT